MNAIEQLRREGKATWIEEAHGWIATPEDIVDALGNEGFVECKRATTTSRRDLRPTGGIWQGVNRSTGSVASTIWMDRPSRPEAIVFVAIDGEAIRGLRILNVRDLDCRGFLTGGLIGFVMKAVATAQSGT